MLTMEITRLIERCRQGDVDALGELYKAYAQQMKGVCRRYFSDEQMVEDVLHDAFVIIFTSFDRLRDTHRAEAWMTAITRNVASKCKDHLEALPMVSLDETNEAVLITEDNEEQDVRGVPLSEVVRMIDRLPEGYRQVFRMSVFEGMSHKEIAAMLGIEPHSSSSQLARAKKMLRRMMQHYWIAVFLLLLLIPFTFFLLKNGRTAVPQKEAPIIAKQKEEGVPQPMPKESPTEQIRESVTAHQPVRQTTATIDDSLQMLMVQSVDSLNLDTLLNMIAHEQTVPDTTMIDTAQIIRKTENPHYDIVKIDTVAWSSPDFFPEKSVTSIKGGRKWSLELAYAGLFDESSRYSQPFSFKPVPFAGQSQPGPSPSPVIPSIIDNWTDYAVYLANNPDAVSKQTRSVIMNIALNNANRPGENKILRTSHHRMPVSCSLVLKYKINSRFGVESGLNYSRLTSDFEMGEDGNVICEHQTIHYLGIPVKVIYNMYNSRKWCFYGSLGLTLEIPVRSTVHANYFVHSQLQASDETAIHASCQFSTTAGVGLQYHLTPRVGFFVEPGLQYFIPMHSDIETYRTIHPFTFSLPIGIKFTW